MLPILAVLLAGLAGAPAPGPDSTPPPPRPSAPVVRVAVQTDEHPRVDGRLDEAVWATAPVIDRFTQRQPDEGRPVSERTEVRIVLGSDALYVGARLFDREPQRIRRRLVRRDEDLASDYFSVFLDSEHGRLTAYRFDVSPAGSYDDATVDAQGNEDRSWDPVWTAAATTDSLGWTAEMEIPLSQLRFRAGANTEWGLQVVRWIDRRQEYAELAFTPKSEHEDVSRYATLTGLGGVHPRQGLEVLPYLLAKSQARSVAPGDPFRESTERTGSVGADIKYRLGGGLTLDATVHPDFGQVEVDPAVVNLSAVETFFPEKRPFFVERSELFDFGQTRSNNYFTVPTAFHARRIGRMPQRALGGPDLLYIDSPAQTTIAGAVKVTGKTAGGWSIGALDAVTAPADAQVMDALGGRREIRVEPLTNYSAARVRREFTDGTTVGAIFTGVVRNLSEDGLGDLLRARAFVGGVDFNRYFGQRLWALDGFLLGSTVSGSSEAIARTQTSPVHYFQRPDADHVSFDPSRTRLSGQSALLSLEKIGGQHWFGSMTYQENGPGFEGNDLGYISSVDMRGFSTLLGYKQDRPGRLVRAWNAMAFSNDSWNFGGHPTYHGYESQGQATLTNYWVADARVSWFPRALDDRLTRGGPLAASPDAGRYWATLSTDPRRVYQFRVRVEQRWDDAGGKLLGVTPSLTVRPSTSLLVRLQPTIQDIRDNAQYVAAVADPAATATYGSRYVFATLDQRVVSLDTRIDWTFSPTLSLQVYLQPYVVSGLYRHLKQLRAPGTFDFEVYGENAGTLVRDADGAYRIDPDGAGPAEAFSLPAPDFNFRSLIGNAVLRWQYRPGSTLFLVWQQHREDTEGFGDFGFRRDFHGLFRRQPENTVAVKATWWFAV